MPPQSISGAPKLSHIDALDGVRGVAVMMVVAHHVAIFARFSFAQYDAFGRGGLLRDIDAYLGTAFLYLGSLGWIGVDLFFVLSGFLITRILWDTKHRAGSLGTFFGRRALRIFPAYFVFLLLAWAVCAVKAPSSPYLHQQVWFWTYLQNIPLGHRGWDAFPPSVHHLWSLSVEEQFYLVWPFAVRSCSKRRALLLCLTCIALAPVIRLATVALHEPEPTLAYTAMPCRMDALAVGAIIALLSSCDSTRARLRSWFRYAGIGAVALLASLAAASNGLVSSDVFDGLVLTPIAILFGSVLVEATYGASLPRMLRARPLQSLGRLSYGLYLFHAPLVIYLPGRFPIFSGKRTYAVTGSLLLAEAVTFTLLLAASIAAAQLSWRLYEKRCLLLKQRIASA